jgi:chitinase
MATVPKTKLELTVSKTSDWGTGYDGQFKLENKNDYDVLQWGMTFDFPESEEFTWFSEGDLVRKGNKVIMVPKDWNMSIPAGTTKIIPFGGVKALPGNLKYNQILPLVGKDPSLAKRGEWSTKAVAPYVDACAFPTPDLPVISKASGLKFFTLAFITADSNNKASWAGVIPLSSQHLLSQVRQIRSSGGDISISFGGANGIELADAIKDIDTLVIEYSKVIDLYSLTRIDFDIEGGAVADTEGVDRRNKAIAILNKKYPNLQITYCLPVLPTGLALAGELLVRNARVNNASIHSFNGMSMDFGDSAAPDPEGRMGEYVIMSCHNLRTQVLSAGYDSPNIGTIPMIGVNDVQSEVFRISDAKKVYDFLQSTPWMTYVGFWSTNRDNAGPDQGANPFNSGIKQNPFDFSKTFLGQKVLELDPSPRPNPPHIPPPEGNPTPLPPVGPVGPNPKPPVPKPPTPKPPTNHEKLPKPIQRPNVNADWNNVSIEFVHRCRYGESPDMVIKDLQTRYSGLGPENQKALKKLLESSKPADPKQPVINLPVQSSIFFAPYTESWGFWSGWNNAKTLDQIPSNNVTLAFVLSADGVPKFDGTMDANIYVDQAKVVQSKGGIVRISFGGATGTELALGIKDVNKLVAAYESVITMYNTRNIDMDIEGGPASDMDSITRRNKALAILQQKYPDLKIDYTLAVMQTGLTTQGLDILKNAKAQGLKVRAINIMAMDYGNGETQMGKAAISAATATKKQCDDLGLVYEGIGITPMIGVNDTAPETFTVDNGKEVVAFAKKTPWVNFLSFWATGRDNPKDTKVKQVVWEFTKLFSTFA